MNPFDEYKFEVNVEDMMELRSRFSFPTPNGFEMGLLVGVAVSQMVQGEPIELPGEEEQDILEITNKTIRHRIAEAIRSAPNDIVIKLPTVAIKTEFDGKIVQVKLIS